jgi:hypothetical protein
MATRLNTVFVSSRYAREKPRPHFAFQHSTLGATTLTSPATSENIDPNPVSSRRVKEDLLPLSPRLTKLYASILSFDDGPPSIPDMKLGSASCGTDFFQQNIRMECVPPAVLQNSPVKQRAMVEQICVMDRIEESGLGDEPGTPLLFEAGVSKPKGWARLHPKAPPASTR